MVQVHVIEVPAITSAEDIQNIINNELTTLEIPADLFLQAIVLAEPTVNRVGRIVIFYDSDA